MEIPRRPDGERAGLLVPSCCLAVSIGRWWWGRGVIHRPRHAQDGVEHLEGLGLGVGAPHPALALLRQPADDVQVAHPPAQGPQLRALLPDAHLGQEDARLGVPTVREGAAYAGGEVCVGWDVLACGRSRSIYSSVACWCPIDCQRIIVNEPAALNPVVQAFRNSNTAVLRYLHALDLISPGFSTSALSVSTVISRSSSGTTVLRNFGSKAAAAAAPTVGRTGVGADCPVLIFFTAPCCCCCWACCLRFCFDLDMVVGVWGLLRSVKRK